MNSYSLRCVVVIAFLATISAGAYAELRDSGKATPSSGQVAGASVSSTSHAPASKSTQRGDTPADATPTSSNALTGTRPQFVIGDSNIVRVPAKVTTLTVMGIAGLDQMATADIAKLANSLGIVDRGLARGTEARSTFEFLHSEFVGRSGANGLTWKIAVKADVPDGTSHVRMAALSFGTPEPQAYAIEFSVSTKPAAASQWTPRGATDIWSLSWSDPPAARVYGIVIENPDEPITNLRLVQSTLKDASGNTIGVQRLRLMDRPDHKGLLGLAVPGNSTRTVFLRFEDGESAGPYGTFDGVIRLTADGSAAMKDVPLKVQASSTGRRWLGVLWTFLGLSLTVFTSALARPRMARLQARRAAAALRHGIGQFRAELGRTVPADVAMGRMKAVAEQLEESIRDDALDQANLLPSRFSLGPGFEASPDMTAALKTKLDEVSNVLEGLLVLLRTGVPPILRLLQKPGERDVALAFARELDELADHVSGPQDAKTKSDELRARVIAAQAAERMFRANPAVHGVTVSHLDLEIKDLALVAWSIWGAIALVIGSAWIFTDPDFGTTVDLVSSFLWGFGLTTFGAGIQNLTPSSVATQMNVKLPK